MHSQRRQDDSTSLRQNAVITCSCPLNNWERVFESECLAPRTEFELWLTDSAPKTNPLRFYLPISTTMNELGTGLGRGLGFFSVGGTGSFCSVAIEKIWWVFGSRAIVRAP